MCDGANRPVTCEAMPNVADREYDPSAFASTTPGEPVMSSAVPAMPSGPGFDVTPTRDRGSEPPFCARWQVPQATVRDDDSCSSQNSTLPRFVFARVIG